MDGAGILINTEKRVGILKESAGACVLRYFFFQGEEKIGGSQEIVLNVLFSWNIRLTFNRYFAAYIFHPCPAHKHSSGFSGDRSNW